MKYVATHVHSDYSDGLYSPKGTVELAKKKGVYALAVTEHDSIKSIDEFLKYGEEKKVGIIPGIEISVVYGGLLKNKKHIFNIHLVGLGIDSKSADFTRYEKSVNESRYKRNKKII